LYIFIVRGKEAAGQNHHALEKKFCQIYHIFQEKFISVHKRSARGTTIT